MCGSLVTGRCRGGSEEPGDFRLQYVDPPLLVAAVASSCGQVGSELANGLHQPLPVDHEPRLLAGADGCPLLRATLGLR